MKRRLIAWGLLLCALPLLLSQACKEPNRPKPNDKFYCKVDGKAWRPDSDGDFKLNTLLAELTNGRKDLYINARNAKINQTITFILAHTNTIEIGTYELSVIKTDSSLPPSAHFYKQIGQSVKNINYETSLNHTGTFRVLSLEKDTRFPTALKMKAEFEFTAANSAGEVVRITNGQFNEWINIKQ